MDDGISLKYMFRRICVSANPLNNDDQLLTIKIVKKKNNNL